MEKKSKENGGPNISVNKLGEYLVANASRQRRILEQFKYPEVTTYGYAPYKDPRAAIKEYFINNFDKTIIEDCILTLNSKSPFSEHQKNIIASELEALNMVLKSNAIRKSGFEYIGYSGDNERVNISGVDISVYPDLIVKSKVKGEDVIGALKIHLSKTGKFGVDGAGYITVLLHEYISKHVAKELGLSSRSKNSFSYDVFTDSFVQCPEGVKRRKEDIEAGCKAIAAIWNAI